MFEETVETVGACVKSADTKIGNDQIFDMRRFDESSRRIRWSENEFSHRLRLKPGVNENENSLQLAVASHDEFQHHPARLTETIC